ncbi:hypothetical protein JKP88DRAFT_246486 [Tribonema minus]|uniref:Uncharacterized protein n=1 Tax=Tribonema minus TaxID=303371 RepID=A0A836CCW8_9STRA|nr:hypothetical protein JKP88DRAFT_246486 [Tribonema minus]
MGAGAAETSAQSDEGRQTSSSEIRRSKWHAALRLLALTLLARTCSAGAADAGPQLVRVLSEDTAGPLCVIGVQTGVQSGMCTLIGGFPQGSAADLLMASRFDDFNGNGTVWSTDNNFGGVMADMVLDFSAETSRLDARKRLTGTAQVDLFICGDEPCNTVADLAYVLPASEPDAPPTLAYGYQRLPNGLLGVPTRYVVPAETQSVLLPSAAEAGPRAPRTVAWAIESPHWVGNVPSLLSFGAFARTLSIDGNLNWGRVRAGNYVDSRGVCVTLFTPAHPWLNARGWGTTEDCESSETYIFETFFAPAYLDLDHFRSADDAGIHLPSSTTDSPSSSWQRTAVLYDPLPLSDVSPYGWRSARWADQALEMSTSLYCVPSALDNAGGVSDDSVACVVNYRPTLLGMDVPTTVSDHIAVVLQIGTAVVLALNATESSAPVPRMDGSVRFPNPLSGDAAAEDPMVQTRWDGELSTPPVTNVQRLMHLAVMGASQLTTLPWCNTQLPNTAEVTTMSTQSVTGPVDATFHWRYVFVRTPVGGVLPLYDCEGLWTEMGWGKPGTPRRPVPAKTGAEIFSITDRNWANVTEDTGGYGPPCDGTGFGGYKCLVVSSVHAGIDTVALTAATELESAVNAQLATADYTLTLAGAVIALAVTTVSLIAGYLGRRELVEFFAKCRLGTAAAKAGAMATTVLAVVVYPATVIVAEDAARAANADGGAGSASAFWLRGDASGFGFYKVVGVMTVAYCSEYDDAAYALSWINLTVAAICTIAMCASIAVSSSTQEVPGPQPHDDDATRPLAARASVEPEHAEGTGEEPRIREVRLRPGSEPRDHQRAPSKARTGRPAPPRLAGLGPPGHASAGDAHAANGAEDAARRWAPPAQLRECQPSRTSTPRRAHAIRTAPVSLSALRRASEALSSPYEVPPQQSTSTRAAEWEWAAPANMASAAPATAAPSSSPDAEVWVAAIRTGAQSESFSTIRVAMPSRTPGTRMVQAPVASHSADPPGRTANSRAPLSSTSKYAIMVSVSRAMRAARGAADGFESLLFAAARAHASGYRTTAGAFGMVASYAALGGAATAAVAAALRAAEGDDGTAPAATAPATTAPATTAPFAKMPHATAPDAPEDSTASRRSSVGRYALAGGVLGLFSGAYVAYVVQRERALGMFTGSGFLGFTAAAAGSCLAAGTPISLARGGGVGAGAAWGALLYAFVGAVPVAVREQYEEARMAGALGQLFERCYPWDEASPCTDAHGGFVKVWDGLVPDFLERALGLKSKAGMASAISALKAEQALDAFHALRRTPAGLLFAADLTPASATRAVLTAALCGVATFAAACAIRTIMMTSASGGDVVWEGDAGGVGDGAWEGDGDGDDGGRDGGGGDEESGVSGRLVEVAGNCVEASRISLVPVMHPYQNLHDVLKQFALLEAHLFDPRRRCLDCINKHFLTIQGLLEEARSLITDDRPLPAPTDVTGLEARVRALHRRWSAMQTRHVIALFAIAAIAVGGAVAIDLVHAAKRDVALESAAAPTASLALVQTGAARPPVTVRIDGNVVVGRKAAVVNATAGSTLEIRVTDADGGRLEADTPTTIGPRETVVFKLRWRKSPYRVYAFQDGVQASSTSAKACEAEGVSPAATRVPISDDAAPASAPSTYALSLPEAAREAAAVDRDQLSLADPEPLSTDADTRSDAARHDADATPDSERRTVVPPSALRTAPVDDFLNTTYEQAVYLINLWLLFVTPSPLDPVINALVLEFIIKLDDEFVKSYLKVSGTAAKAVALEYMKVLDDMPPSTSAVQRQPPVTPDEVKLLQNGQTVFDGASLLFCVLVGMVVFTAVKSNADEPQTCKCPTT